MFSAITHYFQKGTLPFRSISALSDSEAIKVMEDLYDDNPIFERFKDPRQYLDDRKRIEAWLRSRFIEAGGRPVNKFPLYAALGQSNWLEQQTSVFGIDTIRVPLSIFTDADISFTYPDSMVTYTYSLDPNWEHHDPAHHGRVFKLSEVQELLRIYGPPENKGIRPFDGRYGPSIEYIEAQIWNHELLFDYLRTHKLA